MNILVKNEILEDPDITGKELVVYCIIQNLFYSQDRDTILFNYGCIHYELTGEKQMDMSDRISYPAILKSLSNKGYLSIEPLTQGKYILNIRYFDIQDDQFFTRVNANDILRLYKKYGVKSYSLCKQYLYILKTIGERHYYGINELDINSHTGLSAATVGKNNTLLNELGLLYIVFTTNQNHTNTYGKPEYKDEIDAITKKHGIAVDSNIRRSISARFNNMKAFHSMKLEDAERLLEDMEHEIAEHPDLVSDRWNVNEVKEYIAKLKPESINAVEDDAFIKGLFS